MAHFAFFSKIDFIFYPLAWRKRYLFLHSRGKKKKKKKSTVAGFAVADHCDSQITGNHNDHVVKSPSPGTVVGKSVLLMAALCAVDFQHRYAHVPVHKRRRDFGKASYVHKLSGKGLLEQHAILG